MSIGLSFGLWSPAPFTTVAGLTFAAQTMSSGTLWTLTLSPPDPNAGVWAGTIGPGGVVNWPTQLDPSGGGEGLDDPFPAPLISVFIYNQNQIDTGVQGLPSGDALPIIL